MQQTILTTRLATSQDLPYIQKMFSDIVKKMNQQQLNFWDDEYPTEQFPLDIHDQTCHLFFLNGEMVGALVLSTMDPSIGAFKWNKPLQKAYYIERFGVHVAYQRKGIASMILSMIENKAKKEGISCIRLRIVDSNKCAMQCYEKNNYQRIQGSIKEVINDELILIEYGYEKYIND